MTLFARCMILAAYTAVAVSAQTVEKLSGEGQVVRAATFASEPLRVEYRDAAGNLVKNATINWTVTGAGTISPTTTQTDDKGVATAFFVAPPFGPILGDTTTVSTVTASVSSTVKASFLVTVIPFDSTPALSLVAPTGARIVNATSRQVTMNAIRVQTLNSSGQALPNVGVSVSTASDPTSGPVARCQGFPISDATGFATCNLIAGGPAGSFPATVNVGGLVQYTITVNLSPSTAQLDTACVATVSPTSASIPQTGRTGGTFTLKLNSSLCGWDAASDRSWAQIFPLYGVGDRTIEYTVYPNYTTAARTATLSAAGQTVALSQPAATGTADRRFAGQMYFNFFGRIPSTAELNFMETALKGGLTRTQFVLNFMNSEEFNSAGRAVAGLYVGILNRDAEYGGWLFIRNALVGGTPLTTLVANFLSSAEYALRFGTLTDRQFAEQLYRQVLLREPSAAELDFVEGALKSGLSRQDAASNFLNSAEFRIGTGPRLTAFLAYATTLLRDPTTTELSSTVALLSSGTAPGAVIEALLASTEFAALLI